MFRITRWAFVPTAWAILMLANAGCGNPKVELPQEDEVAESKVQAIKELADAMAKNPDGMEAKAALENFRLIGLDPRKTPKQAAEISEIYRTKILNKYKGSVAQELKGEIAPYLSATKAAK
jgi:hypothetical protein